MRRERPPAATASVVVEILAMMMKEPYAALLITLLDRASGKTVTHYAYPATRVELRDIKADLQCVFSVGPDGSWQEEERICSPG